MKPEIVLDERPKVSIVRKVGAEGKQGMQRLTLR